MRQKIPKISVHFFSDPFYKDHYYEFAFCSRRSGGKYGIVGEFNTCREVVCEIAAVSICNKAYGSACYKMDTLKPRILVIKPYSYGVKNKEQVENFDNSIWRALRIIHHLEDAAGWAKSKLLSVQNRYTNEYQHAFLFIGPQQWLRSPHMLSLYLLLIRLGHFKEFEDFKNRKEFMSVCAIVSNKQSPHKYDDPTYLSDIYSYLYPLLENFEEVFKGTSKKEYFDRILLNAYGEGISALCNGYADRGFSDKFKKVINKS